MSQYGVSNRQFAMFFSVFFALITALLYQKMSMFFLLTGGVSIFFCIIGILVPIYLSALNSLWMRFGKLLHHIVSPVILGILYFILIVPIGVIMRFKRCDPMNRSFKSELQSYWIPRAHIRFTSEDLKHQF